MTDWVTDMLVLVERSQRDPMLKLLWARKMRERREAGCSLGPENTKCYCDVCML